MEESRTQNTVKNVKTGAIVQLVNKLMSFAVRTIFIMMLNTEYLGVNGLFTNILTMLSFTELGIGTAIIFNMYKPIAEDDKEKIKSLMRLYKKSYFIIGTIIFALGLCIIPFMKYIVKEVPNIKENIIIIYLLFLFNTASSYFFTYKKSIIIAYQKQSIINNIDSFFYLIRSMIEIIFLFLTRNYIVYLIIEILSTLIENIILAKKADKLFPFIKEKNIKEINKAEKNGIFDNVKSLIVYKFGEVILSGTDNILISSMVNVSTVGLCSNYTLIIQAIKSIVSTSLGGVTASVGNLNASKDTKRKEEIFYQLTFINFIIYSFCTLAFIILLEPFIKLWLGENYLLGMGVVIALSLNFFIDGIRNPGFIFRTTLGLFSKGKITPYIGSIVNIIASIIFCKIYGVVGIFIGTIIAQVCSYVWIDPYLVHKYEFKTPFSKYLKKFLMYVLTLTIEIVIALCITSFIENTGIINFILRGFIALLVPNVINIILFHKLEEFKALKEKFIQPLLKKIFCKMKLFV